MKGIHYAFVVNIVIAFLSSIVSYLMTVELNNEGTNSGEIMVNSYAILSLILILFTFL